MVRRFVQGLEKGGVQHEQAAGLKDTVDFTRRERGLTQMFEDIEGKDAIEGLVAKRQSVGVADDIGVTKNLVLELDAVQREAA